MDVAAQLGWRAAINWVWGRNPRYLHRRGCGSSKRSSHVINLSIPLDESDVPKISVQSFAIHFPNDGGTGNFAGWSRGSKNFTIKNQRKKVMLK